MRSLQCKRWIRYFEPYETQFRQPTTYRKIQRRATTFRTKDTRGILWNCKGINASEGTIRRGQTEDLAVILDETKDALKILVNDDFARSVKRFKKATF